MEYETLSESMIQDRKDDLIRFFMKLDIERKTLFKEEFSEEEYPETIKLLINSSLVIVTAVNNSEIIGIAGVNRPYKSGINKIIPFVRGFIAVLSSFQGRGIGSQLSQIRNQYMEKIPVFHISIILKQNYPMIRVVQKLGYIRFHQNNEYIFHFKTFHKYLAPFSFLFYILFKIIYRKRFP